MIEKGIAAYQQQLHKLVDDSPILNYPPETTDTLALHALALSGEAGEIANKVKKVIWYGLPVDCTDIEEESGDVLWHVAEMATLLGTTLDKIADVSLAKTKLRNSND